jgi:hypothetical protein
MDAETVGETLNTSSVFAYTTDQQNLITYTNSEIFSSYQN